jgi:hypothetical protein
MAASRITAACSASCFFFAAYEMAETFLLAKNHYRPPVLAPLKIQRYSIMITNEYFNCANHYWQRQ